LLNKSKTHSDSCCSNFFSSIKPDTTQNHAKILDD
jgi:hypothetical protein